MGTLTVPHAVTLPQIPLPHSKPHTAAWTCSPITTHKSPTCSGRRHLHSSRRQQRASSQTQVPSRHPLNGPVYMSINIIKT